MDYREVADLVAQDIAAGRLGPGAQLPPHRRFARTASPSPPPPACTANSCGAAW